MTIAVIMAILAAASIGIADFFLGIAGRRDPGGAVLVPMYAAMTLAAVALLPLGGSFSSEDLLVGVVVGIAWPVAIVAIMRGVAEGRVVVAVPVAGVLTATVPVVADLIGGSVPTVMVGVGVVIGLVALVLTGLGSEEEREGTRSAAWSVAMGAICGTATGSAYIAIDSLDSSGMVPLVVGGVMSCALAMIFLALAGRLRRPPGKAILPGAIAGVLLALVFAFLAVGFDRGSLTVVGVISSQHTIFTLGLAAFVWRQRPRGIQYVGVAMSMVAVAMIAAGA